MQKPTLHFVYTSVILLILAACASIGSPEGGPLDETPPKILKCQPANMTTNSQKKKITLVFDEYINIENASEKVIVSPPQVEAPDINTSGKKIHITLHDSLKSNTTYTVDFSDAIVDNNEGNPMGQFTYTFSTGENIDSLEVSGTLLDAGTLEPVKGMLVGLHSNLEDSAFTKLPLERVSRTNSDGRFTIKGVAPGKYRIYGLQDADGNFMFSQKSEMIAFDSVIINPYCKPDWRPDTIWRDSTHIDTVRQVPYTHFYPDNIILRGFAEDFQTLHLLKTERPTPDMFTIYFTGPSDTIPQIRGLNFEGVEHFILEPSLQNDTLTYWITDTLVSNKDTLSISLTYLDTDTLNQLVYRTDTLDLVSKISRDKQKKELQAKIEEWEKEQKKEKRRQKEKYVEQECPYLKKEELKYQVRPAGAIAPDQNITFTFDEPIAVIDTSAFHFYKQQDTLWIEEPFLFLPKENDQRSYVLYAEWHPGERYRFEADSSAVRSILDKESAQFRREIPVSKEEDFSSLFVRLILPDTGAVVQLMNNSDKVVKSIKAENNRADFFYVTPGDYYLRLFIDRNGDGVWNTGAYDQKLQPEEVFYFPKPLSLKARWEFEQDWEVRGIPLDQQKPAELSKQKSGKSGSSRR